MKIIKFNIIILLAILVNLFIIECQIKNKQGQQFSDDEFSEFDSMDEDSKPVASNNNKKSTPNNEQVVTPNTNNKKDDFASFDNEAIVSNEDEETPSTSNDKNTQKQNEQPSKPVKAQQDPVVKKKSTFNDDLDMEEFEHLADDEEFEGYDSKNKESKPAAASPSNSDSKSTSKTAKDNSMPNLKIANVPTHLMSTGNWQNYIWEIVMLVIIAIYFINFIYGKTKNYRLVTAWYQAHRDLLERNFTVVGDDGNSTEIPKQESNEIGTLIKESENSYGLWCTGRQMCDGMLVQLKLVKRQDLINGVIMQMIKPQSDQIMISVEFPNPDDIDNFVFCLTNKKISQQLFNDYLDLSSYCTEKKTVPSSGGGGASSFFGDYKYVDLITNPLVVSRFTMLNELGEVPNSILDSRVCAVLNKYPEMIEYLLISDQYVGYKTPTTDDQNANSTPTDLSSTTVSSIGLTKSRPILLLCLNVPGKGTSTTAEDMEKMLPAFQLALYLIDKVPRIRLSKEAKAKAIKKRKEVAEQYMKLTHKQRQEAAMLRKEEKRRAEKEKIMNESDPEKQRKLEEKELKREKKKSLSKMKQVKIKSM